MFRISRLFFVVATAGSACIGLATRDLLVSGRGDNRIARYNGDTGAYEGTFASGNGLSSPVGLTFGPDGDLYVANGLGKDVLRFDQSGNYLGVFASGSGLGQPRDLVFGPDGDLYVASGTTKQIFRFDSNGNFVDVFASAGLNGPVGLTFGPDGNLYVSSALTNQVIRYNHEDGSLMGVFAQGNGLSNPTDLLFRGNYLYVLSAVNNEVLRYDAVTGAPVSGTFASGGGLNVGIGMLFNDAGNLLVGSNQTNQVLQYDGTSGAFTGVFANGNVSGPNGMTFFPAPEIDSAVVLGAGAALAIGRRRKIARGRRTD